MNATSSSPPRGERALVLGGGGSTGNAWLIGVVAGLLEGGVDVTGSDLTVGTSAGSTAAAQLGAAGAIELYASVVDAPAGPHRSAGARGPAGSAADHLERLRAVIAGCSDAAEFRRRMGAAAVRRSAESDGSARERWRSTVAARLPSTRWPDRPVLIAAVDAESGEPVVFDRDSDVDLVDAVAASCSSSFAYEIGGRAYIDGGYRSNADNADLAASHDRVLVLSPLSGRSLHPPAWGTDLATKVGELRARGSRVETVFPDSGSEHLFGANAMDVSLRPEAARAGHDQGVALAGRIAGLWR